MRCKFLLFVVFTLLFELVACAKHGAIKDEKIETNKTIYQRNILIGKWSGKSDLLSGGTRTWTTHRYPDGTFRVDFSSTDEAGNVSNQTESGIWGVSGDIYFTATRGFIENGVMIHADTTDASLYDTYKIITISDKKFEYVNLSTGNRFEVERVNN